MSDEAITISNLEYDYPGQWIFDRRPVLRSFSMTVKRGESFGFLGHNGAGKTTTIKTILNVNRVRKGTIHIFGIPHTDRAARAQIGYLPEQPYFYDHLTVEEMLEMYGLLSGIPHSLIQERIAWALDAVRLSKRSTERLRSLSKGLVQRAGMAQAIIAQPKLLILDEPFSGLDPLGRKDFRELLSDLKARGTTIFMSSHILSDVEFLCDRVSIMSKGVLKGVFAVKEIPSMSAANFEIVCEDSDRLREFIATRALEVGINNGRATVMIKSRDNAEQLLKEMLEHKVRVDSFNTVQNSLEDVFVRLVTFDESARS